MGLGLFISKTLLENLSAKVTFNNDKNSKTEKGAIVRIIFDRKKIANKYSKAVIIVSGHAFFKKILNPSVKLLEFNS